MSMTPDQFLCSFVYGNFDDFRNSPDDIRRGFNAAIAASHMADHYFNYYKKNDPKSVSKFKDIGKYLEYVSKQTNGDFTDIRSVANAYKHLYTNANAVISSTGAIDTLEIKDEDVSEVMTNYSKVIYTKRTGEQRELLPVLENVVNFWQKEVCQVGEDIEIIPPPNKENNKNNSE
jgi:hypothetical protein